MASSGAKKVATKGRKKKASVATASRCTGAPAPRRNLKPRQKAKVTEDDEMTGVEEAPLPKVDIYLTGEPYGDHHDCVSATACQQCNILMHVVVLQRLSRSWRPELPFLSPNLVLQMHRPH